MVRFIFACMAFAVLSFALTPAYFGIKKEQQKLAQSTIATTNSDTPLSFEEIYALADVTGDIDPAMLNAIAPAAGDESEAAPQPEIFSNGFSGIALNSLAE